MEGSMATDDNDAEEEDEEEEAGPAGVAGEALGDTGSPGLSDETSGGFNVPLNLLGGAKGLLLNDGRRSADMSGSPPCEMLSSGRVRSSGPRESWNEAICVLTGNDMRLLK